ncbi:hypothetical protein TNCV_3636671 [Trichonephila clavipes]|nr:hypothetical protein TNCV_3636671 [Trichonephila clavipes]
MINGRTRLHVVANGTMTGQRYIDEVLLPHVRLFRGAVGDKFVFMDDNATCHRTLAVQDCLDCHCSCKVNFLFPTFVEEYGIFILSIDIRIYISPSPPPKNLGFPVGLS